MVDAQGKRQFIKRDDRGIAAPTFESAQILLTEAGAFLDLLMRQALFLAQARKISADQFAHIHARIDRDLHTFGLSTSLFVKRVFFHINDDPVFIQEYHNWLYAH